MGRGLSNTPERGSPRVPELRQREDGSTEPQLSKRPHGHDLHLAHLQGVCSWCSPERTVSGPFSLLDQGNIRAGCRWLGAKRPSAICEETGTYSYWQLNLSVINNF